MTKTQLRQIAQRLQVTEYPDYKTFLAALYTEAKKADPSYSFALLSADLELGSSNAHSIIHGKRPLTEKAGKKIAEALHLTGLARRYFLALIKQTRARNAADRDAAFEERLDVKRQVLPNELSRDQLDFFAHWYNAAILELLRLPRAQDDAEWIAGELRPEIPTAAAKDALSLLKRLGYLKESKEHGRLVPTEVTITSGNEVRGLAITSYHRQMLALAAQALDQIPQAERDVSAVTVTATAEQFAKIKDEIVALRKRLLAGASDAPTDGATIYQVNVQLFPLVKKERSS